MRIGDEVYIHGYVDEIRKDTVIIRNDGGYFGTVKSEIRESCGTGKRISDGQNLKVQRLFLTLKNDWWKKES